MGNPFAQLMNDTVFIEEADGTRTGPYKSSIGSKNGLSATLFEPKLDVEEGWKLIRPLPSGKEESYTILEATYSPGLHAIPPSWQLRLQKDTAILPRSRVAQNTTINISNSQGIQIGDHNVQHIANSLMGLAEKIQASDSPPEQKAAARGLLQQLLNSPVVASVLGSATSGVLALLGQQTTGG